jgi:hypothetical protein
VALQWGRKLGWWEPSRWDLEAEATGYLYHYMKMAKKAWEPGKEFLVLGEQLGGKRGCIPSKWVQAECWVQGHL